MGLTPEEIEPDLSTAFTDVFTVCAVGIQNARWASSHADFIGFSGAEAAASWLIAGMP